jgi:hypothetical protein
MLCNKPLSAVLVSYLVCWAFGLWVGKVAGAPSWQTCLSSVEHLPSKDEALNSNSSTAKKQTNKQKNK